MGKNVLIIGYGSIGRRHARNLLELGIAPYILTRHPDSLHAEFSKDLDIFKNKNIEYCIISSATARHLDDLKRCVKSLSSVKKILVEKPLECSYLRGQEIKNIARKRKLEIFVGYNLRFMSAFGFIRGFIKKYKNKIKIVEAVAGQDLRQWRPYKDIKCSYSAYRDCGGGVDLDLSHEIDYVLWLFGDKFKNKYIYRAKISSLNIDSPDIFKLFLDYKDFIVDITLDYIRKPKDRYLKIVCDNGKKLYYDFITGALEIDGKNIFDGSDELNKSYKVMLNVFLGVDKSHKAKSKLCSVEDGLNVLKILEV